MAERPQSSTPASASGVDSLTLTRLQPPSHPGDVGTLDRYRVVKQIGEGGMGVIYLGIDTRLQRRVALKVIRAEYATSKAARTRFLKESRALAAVKHENIVTLFDVGETNGTPYLAMEFLRGVSLQEFLAKRNVPTLVQTLRIAREVASGLAAAHSLGVVHRDIKPENIWLEIPHGRVKLLDFGLARPPIQDPSDYSRPGSVIGTPSYMPPEQARGMTVDHRADLYSLGAVLYELTTGRLPFTGETAVAVMIAVVTSPPVPPRRHNPHIPLALESLILRLMAKDPAQRPNSALEVSAELTRIEQSLAAPQPTVAAPMQDLIPTADPASEAAGPLSLPVGAVAVSLPPEPPVSGLSEFASLDIEGEPPPSPRRSGRETGTVEWALAIGTVFVALTMSLAGIWIIARRPAPNTEPEVASPNTRTPDTGSNRTEPVAFTRADATPIPPFTWWRMSAAPMILASVPESERILIGTEEGPYLRDLKPHAYRIPLDLGDSDTANCWVGAGTGRLAVATKDGMCRIFDATKRTPIGDGIPVGPSATTFAISPNGDLLAAGPTGTDASITVYATATGRRVIRLPGHDGKPISAAAFSPDNQSLATIGLDGTARVWNLKNGSELASFRTRFAPDSTRNFTVEFDTTGRQLLAYGPPGRAAVWSLERKAELSRWDSPDLLAVAFTPDGQQVLIGGAGQWVSLFAVGNSTAPVFEFDTQHGPIHLLEFTSDRRTLMTAHADRVRFWDWGTIETAMRGSDAPTESPNQFTSLFNGTSLNGWVHRDTTSRGWTVSRKALTGTSGSKLPGGWIQTRGEYGDVELRFEYRFLVPGSDSGFAIRLGAEEPTESGLEINLLDDANFYDVYGWKPGPFDRTGAVSGTTEPIAESPNRRLGQWNQVRAVAEGRKLIVDINGTRVQDTELPEQAIKGPIGFQSNAGRVQFRSIFVRELPAPTAEGGK